MWARETPNSNALTLWPIRLRSRVVEFVTRSSPLPPIAKYSTSFFASASRIDWIASVAGAGGDGAAACSSASCAGVRSHPGGGGGGGGGTCAAEKPL